MTAERDFDLIARAWLELGPNEAPERVVNAVLAAADATPQVPRRLRLPLPRIPTMNRAALLPAAIAAVALAVGAVALFTGNQHTAPLPSIPLQSPTGPVSSASPTSSGSAAEPLPPALRSTWASAPRIIAGLGPPGGTMRMDLTDRQLSIPNNYRSFAQLASEATQIAPGKLRLVLNATSSGCASGDAGRYLWSLSPGGNRLTLTLDDDPCHARAEALPGEWFRIACKRVTYVGGVTYSDCYGLLEPGTYPVQYFGGSVGDGACCGWDWGDMSYTVPEGWANSEDQTDVLRLTPSTNFASEDQRGAPAGQMFEIAVFRRPPPTAQDANCGNGVPRLLDVPRSVDGLLAYVANMDSLETTTPRAITVDGKPGKWIDVRLSSGWTATCPGAAGAPTVVALGNVRLSSAERQRWIFVDLGQTDVVPDTVLVVIDSSDPTRFDELVSRALPIIESFTLPVKESTPQVGPSTISLVP